MSADALESRGCCRPHSARADSYATFEITTLGAFLERCSEYFPWSGSLISQPYQARLADGMIRCYFVHDRVVGFCHQWPSGLLDAANLERDGAGGPARPARGPMVDASTPGYAALGLKAEFEWVPDMRDLLDLDTLSLPVIWDADFLYGPKDESGADNYVLCEINVSAVWPFPPQATRAIAEAAVARIRVDRAGC